MRILCLTLALCGTAAADDAGDRDRKARAARAALALAGKPARPLAPAPHAPPKSYSAGYTAAVADAQPLVVFVSCAPVAIDGAVTAKADQFAGVTGPAVVVAFPLSDRLHIDAVLPGEPKPEDVAKAVKAATRKIDLPPSRAMPAAPRPLNWSH